MDTDTELRETSGLSLEMEMMTKEGP